MGIEPVALSDPGAGQALSFTIGTGKTQILRSLAFWFNTSAAVADRYVRLMIDNGSGLAVYFYGENNVPQVAGFTAYYSFALGYHSPVTAPATNGVYRAFSLPAIVLKSGWRVYATVDGIDGSDQIVQGFYQLQDVNPNDTHVF